MSSQINSLYTFLYIIIKQILAYYVKNEQYYYHGKVY